MATIKRLLRLLMKLVIFLLVLFVGYVIYLQSLTNVHPKTVEYYKELIVELREAGYTSNVMVTSTYRPKWYNDILVQFGGAASKSQHLVGRAIDIVVLDVNGDGRANGKDVDIVYHILHRKIIKNKGGIGTYKNERPFLAHQMVHLDSRGHRARWHR